MTLLLALLVGWIAVSVPVAIGVGRASHIAAQRDVERRVGGALSVLRTSESAPLRRVA